MTASPAGTRPLSAGRKQTGRSGRRASANRAGRVRGAGTGRSPSTRRSIPGRRARAARGAARSAGPHEGCAGGSPAGSAESKDPSRASRYIDWTFWGLETLAESTATDGGSHDVPKCAKSLTLAWTWAIPVIPRRTIASHEIGVESGGQDGGRARLAETEWEVDVHVDLWPLVWNSTVAMFESPCQSMSVTQLHSALSPASDRSS